MPSASPRLLLLALTPPKPSCIIRAAEARLRDSHSSLPLRRSEPDLLEVNEVIAQLYTRGGFDKIGAMRSGVIEGRVWSGSRLWVLVRIHSVAV